MSLHLNVYSFGLILYFIRQTVAKLDLWLTYSTRIGILESLFISNADCHGNHTVLTVAVLKIVTIPNSWCLLIAIYKNRASIELRENCFHSPLKSYCWTITHLKVKLHKHCNRTHGVKAWNQTQQTQQTMNHNHTKEEGPCFSVNGGGLFLCLFVFSRNIKNLNTDVHFALESLVCRCSELPSVHVHNNSTLTLPQRTVTTWVEDRRQLMTIYSHDPLSTYLVKCSILTILYAVFIKREKWHVILPVQNSFCLHYMFYPLSR